MGRSFVVIVKGDADWITFSRAHFLKQAMLHPTRFGGIHYFDPDHPEGFMQDPGNMWTLFMCGHGSEDVICDCDGKTLAEKMGPFLPSTEGRINVMSCGTGKGSAKEFADGLRTQGKKVLVVAPEESCTYTSVLFFRVLNPPTFTPKLQRMYVALKTSKGVAGGDKATLAARVKSEDVASICREMAEASRDFWQDFNTIFAGCFSKAGEGWKEFPTYDESAG